MLHIPSDSIFQQTNKQIKKMENYNISNSDTWKKAAGAGKKAVLGVEEAVGDNFLYFKSWDTVRAQQPPA